MKKLTNLIIAFTATIGTAYAGIVPQSIAEKVATNFYSQNFGTQVNTITMAFTEKDASGDPAYYVFNINAKDGFVIVSAEDAGRPIIGCSNKGKIRYSRTQYKLRVLDE